SLKTSIKTITYLSDIGCLEIQGASLIALYVIDMGNKDTCRYLQEVLSENEDPYLVKEFNAWIKEIKKKY
ncbi:hypothetical protein C9173_21460, partial [Escherichia coli]